MDDDEYYNNLMSRSERTLDDVANDVRQHMTGAVENIIKAGKALQEGRDMHPSDELFGKWCKKEFPHLHYKMRQRMMDVGRRFSKTFMSDTIVPTVLYELSSKSVPQELAEDFLSSEEPVKVKDVKEAKKEYKQIQEMPEFADLREKVEAREITPREAIKEKVARMPVVPEYNVNEGMGALAGISQLYAREYKGTKEQAAKVLFDTLTQADDNTGIGRSIAVDCIKWFFTFKEVMDIVTPSLEEYLEDQPKLSVVK